MSVVRKYGVRKKLLFYGTFYLIFFLLIELVFRLFQVSPLREYDSSPVYHHIHARDYRYNQQINKEYGGFDIYFDDKGLISSPASSSEDIEKRKKIYFLGDSFTEGFQVPFDSSFCGILSQEFLDIEFKNFGVSSYSPCIYYLQAKYLLTEFEIPDRVIVMLFSNDVSNDSTYTEHMKFSENGELVGVNGQNPALLNRVLRQSYFLKFLYAGFEKISYWLTHDTSNEQVVGGYVEENPDFESTLSSLYLEKTVSELKSKGIEVFITAVPSKYAEFSGDYSKEEFAEKIEKWANSREVNFINLHQPFQDAFLENGEPHFFQEDIHFNNKGHQLVAEVIARSL